MNLSEALLREIVTKVLERTGGGDGDLQRQVDPSGVIGIHTPAVVPLPFDGHPDVLVRDVVTLAEAPRMGCGVMELKNGVSFPWTLHYDEYDIILEGTLEIEIDGRVVRGGAGDVIYIPKGTSICLRTPDRARYIYTVYPADWNG